MTLGDDATEHVAQYLMAVVRVTRLTTSAFVEETGDIGACFIGLYRAVLAQS